MLRMQCRRTGNKRMSEQTHKVQRAVNGEIFFRFHLRRCCWHIGEATICISIECDCGWEKFYSKIWESWRSVWKKTMQTFLESDNVNALKTVAYTSNYKTLYMHRMATIRGKRVQFEHLWTFRTKCDSCRRRCRCRHCSCFCRRRLFYVRFLFSHKHHN